MATASTTGTTTPKFATLTPKNRATVIEALRHDYDSAYLRHEGKEVLVYFLDPMIKWFNNQEARLPSIPEIDAFFRSLREYVRTKAIQGLNGKTYLLCNDWDEVFKP